MTDEQTPPAELIEAMARAYCVNAGFDPDEIMPNDGPRWRYYVPGCTAALAALRETLVPVGHRYTNIADGSVTFTPNKWNMNGNYFVETPLYALPEVKP